MNESIIFFGLADWISDQEPNYPTFDECKKWIQSKDNKYKNLLTKKDEDDIKMLLLRFQLDHLSVEQQPSMVCLKLSYVKE